MRPKKVTKGKEIICRDPNCENRGIVPLKVQTSLCRECGARDGVTSQFRSTATKAQQKEQTKQASKRAHELKGEQCEASRRAIVAEHPLASPEARAARNAELVKLCKSKPPAGEFFTHERLGKSKRCLCNCAFMKLLGEHPEQVRVLMMYLMGSVPMQIGDIVSIPEITLHYAYYVAKTAKEKYPDQIDPRAPMPWNFWEHQKTNFGQSFPEYINPKCDASTASRYDNAKASVHGCRVSIKLKSGNMPLPPALVRTGKGIDSLGVCVFGEVDTKGKPVWQFPVWMNGEPDVLEVFGFRRQAVLAHVLDWKKEDFDNFKARLTLEEVKDVVSSDMEPQDVLDYIDRFYKAFEPAFAAGAAALLRMGGGDKMPAVKDVAAALNAVRYAAEPLAPFREDGVDEDDLRKTVEELERLVGSLAALLDKTSNARVVASSGGGAGEEEEDAPPADEEEEEQEAPAGDEEDEEEDAAAQPDDPGDEDYQEGEGDDDEEEEEDDDDDDAAAGLPPPPPPPTDCCKKRKVGDTSAKMRKAPSGLPADCGAMQSMTGIATLTA